MDDPIPVEVLVTDVTAAINAVVTTASDHNFSTGQYVRLVVPKAYGMEVPYRQTTATVLSATSFRTDLDLSAQPAFSTPTNPPPFTPAQAVPVSGTWFNNATPVVGR